MSKLAQLRERRNAKSIEANALNDKYPSDQRMPKEELEKLDAVLAEIESIDNDIKRSTRIAQLAAQESGQVLDDLRNRHTVDPSKQADPERAAALRAFLGGGISALNDKQRTELMQRMTPDIRQAMSTTTTTEGGFTVATEYMRSLEAAKKAYGGMLQVANVIHTGSGADMNFPTADATAEVGEIVGQNAAATGLDTAFGNTSLSVYKYSSKKIALPWELTQDSFLDIEAYIQEVLAVRLGRITNTHFTVGTGTGQPRGVVTGAALGKTGLTGQTLTVIYDDLVDLEHSVNRAYRAGPGVGYMMADSSLKVLRKVKDGNQRPVFVPGYENSNPGGAPDTLLGRPITINDDVAAMAANAKSILFGAFKKYVIRNVMDLTLFRMTDSAFTLNGQVGFVAFQRLGGNLIDAGGAIKYYANSAT
jgi:HK97 family phage major capsid protein